jgi:uncharacterized membrane protein
MEWMFVAVLVLGIPIGLAVWLIARAIWARDHIDDLSRRLLALELEISRLKPGPETPPAKAFTPREPGLSPVSMPAEAPKPGPVPPAPAPITAPPPLPIKPLSTPPPLLPAEPRLSSAPAREMLPKINWEQFMGVKLFAWIGGLALFLGVAFFIKYSFDNNLVPPQLRVALGFLAGLVLLVGGVVMSRKDYPALSQTLCGTGVVILYSVTFACRSIYHFEFFGPAPTFLLMVLITATAFLLSVRLPAQAVAVLGMVGGFLTPVLLSTGQDNPGALFGYIAILDTGLLVVALHRRWFYLATLAGVGTILMQIGWADKFFTAEQYFAGNKILIAIAVLLGFNLLYIAACWWARSRAQSNKWLSGSALGLAAMAFAFAGWFLTFAPLAERPWLLFSFIFLIDLAVTAVVLLDDTVAVAHPVAGLAVFGLLAFWTAESLRNDLLNAALAFYFILAVGHSVFPAFIQRRRGVSAPPWAGQLFPPLALVLVLLPIFRLEEVSFLVWPFVLLVDLLAMGLALLTVSLLPAIVVLVLTLGATGALFLKIPATLTGLPTSLFLLGAFAVFFVAAGLWLTRRFKPDSFKGESKIAGGFSTPANLAAQLPLLAAILPFLLLIMVTLRLPLANPGPVFGLALLLSALLLGVSRLFLLDWLPAIGLACVTALECTWHFNRFDPAQPAQPMAWYLIFLAVFALFPFFFQRQFGDKVVPWAAAAMAGPPAFFLVHRLVAAAFPNHVMGLLPAAFAVLPLLSLVVVLKRGPAAGPARLTQLAWFGGEALFFITLIFPIQFDREWITIGWALEGTALLWLFHRIPHPGLRLTGAGLLVAAFIRLALNPAVLEYHVRSATPILNWYLYAYGIVTVCLFCGARLLAPPYQQVLGLKGPSVLAALGTILAFLLLNIQIADFFSAPGSTLTFQFSGNFARDMTYSIAWALFALVLLVVGILRKTPASRYAALALLSLTLLKLFFHDLASLGQLYRIGAFIGVAVIAMLASFAYQRFFSAAGKEKEPSHAMHETTP